MKINRLDHHGIVAGVINDLGIVDLIDKNLYQDDKQEITPGEAVKGMIMNGLGFSNRPLSLSPQFFKNLPVEHLFRKGVEAEHFNRHKLGRTLDQCHEFGCETLFSEIALEACDIESVNKQFHSLDTTSYSLTGRYEQGESTEDECEEQASEAINITYGYSKDHRPDLKQVVQEMIVSQDGGIPLHCKNWDGNSSDNVIFKERAKALISSFRNSEEEQYCVADSKLYHKDNAEFLKQINFITLVPSSNKLEQESIEQALAEDNWQTIDKNYQYNAIKVDHMDINQRWLIVHSQAAKERSTKTVERQISKAEKTLKKALYHLQAQRFDCQKDAEKVLNQLTKKQHYHDLISMTLTPHHKYEGKGRPVAGAPIQSTQWQINAEIQINEEKRCRRIEQKSCFVIATNTNQKQLTHKGLLERYKAQSHVEKGFRFLKDPLFFVSSLFIKKPSRIDALLMIMTLALLVYSIAQRRLRIAITKHKTSVPNQINQSITTPTMRWIFQCFEGINTIQTGESYKFDTFTLDGMDDLRKKVIFLLGGDAKRLYKNQNFNFLI